MVTQTDLDQLATKVVGAISVITATVGELTAQVAALMAQEGASLDASKLQNAVDALLTIVPAPAPAP